MKLVYKKTGKEVQVGDEVTLSDGEKVQVTFFQPPHKAASSGKVAVQSIGAGRNWNAEYYVSVIGAEWIEREDRPKPHAPATVKIRVGIVFTVQRITPEVAEGHNKPEHILEVLDPDGDRYTWAEDLDEAKAFIEEYVTDQMCVGEVSIDMLEE